jgi:hypothetical protein
MRPLGKGNKPALHPRRMRPLTAIAPPNTTPVIAQGEQSAGTQRSPIGAVLRRLGLFQALCEIAWFSVATQPWSDGFAFRQIKRYPARELIGSSQVPPPLPIWQPERRTVPI